MEPNLAGATDLPPGVSQVGATPAPAEAAAAAAAAAPIEQQPAIETDPNTEMMEEGGNVGKWNALELLGGIVVMTVFLFTIAYYRVKTLVVDEEIKNQQSKLSDLQSAVNKLKTDSNG